MQKLIAGDDSETKGESPMDSQKIYLLAELTVLPEFLDDVKGALKQALIPTLQEAGCEGMFETLFNRKDFVAAEKFWSPNYIQDSAHIPPGRVGLFGLIKSVPPGSEYG